MMDSVETLLAAKQVRGIPLTQDESAYVKRIVKEISSTFPCEWDEALEELEQKHEKVRKNNSAH